jgi:hypothetical protein
VRIQAGAVRLDDFGTPSQITGIWSDANKDSSGDAGTVSLTVDGLLEVLNGAAISSDTYAQGSAGDVRIQAGAVRLDDFGTPNQLTGIMSDADSGSIGDAGAVSVTADGLIEVLNGAVISSATWGLGKGGEVKIIADSMRLDDFSTPKQDTGIRSGAGKNSNGDGGAINLQVSGLIEVINEASIWSSTSASGNAGGITLTAGAVRLGNLLDANQASGIVSQADGGSSGDAGMVSLKVAGLLEVFNGGEISSSTFAEGSAGSVTITAGAMRLDNFGTSNLFTGVSSDAQKGSGDAGAVLLEVDGLLEILNGTQISSNTFAEGSAGSVTIKAGSARLDAFGILDKFTGIASQSGKGSRGDAGTISLMINDLLEVLNGAQISSGTFGYGKGGDVRIMAGSVRLDEFGTPEQHTKIWSGTDTDAVGDGGSIRLHVDGLLEMFNGAQILSSTRGAGKGGDIEITAGAIRLDNFGMPDQNVGILSDANEGSSGNAGSISVLVTGPLEMLNGARISSSTRGFGKAGDVTIAASAARLDNFGTPNQNTAIWSDTDSDAQGGIVSMRVNGLLEVVNGAVISTSTFGPGKAGELTITAGAVRLDKFGTSEFTGLVSHANSGSSGDAGTVQLDSGRLAGSAQWGARFRVVPGDQGKLAG